MIAVVVRRNPWFNPGTWVEKFDDGWQACTVDTYRNRLRVTGNVGLVYPNINLHPFIMRPCSQGLDKGKKR